MIEKIKDFIKRFKIFFIVLFVVIVISVILSSCSSIGDNNKVQFGLTNEAVSGLQVKDEGFIIN